jgi:hypothetical protein
MAKPKYPAWFVTLWQRALDVEIGIRFEVSGWSREQFRNFMYEARQAARDPRLQELMMFLPAAPHDNEVWLCKKTVELDP